MAIGITEEHEELRQAVRRFVDTNIPPSAVRTAVDAADARATELPSIDLSRRVAQLDLEGARPGADQRLEGLTSERVRGLAAVLLASEAVGVAQWCVDTAAEYAKVRVQFGRPIGQ